MILIRDRFTTFNYCHMRFGTTCCNADYLAAFCERQNRQRTFLLVWIKYVKVTDPKFDRSALDALEWEDCGVCAIYWIPEMLTAAESLENQGMHSVNGRVFKFL